MGPLDIALASARFAAEHKAGQASASRVIRHPIRTKTSKGARSRSRTSGLKAFGNDRREPMRQMKTLLAAGLIAAATALPAAAADISGAGATFPYPVYAKWADTYKKETNVGLNYQSIGSGGGIKQI